MLEPVKPNWRNGVGMLLILLLLVVWSVAVVALSPYVAQLWWGLEFLFYLVAGIGWIFPVRPLITWMGTGRWRLPKVDEARD